MIRLLKLIRNCSAFTFFCAFSIKSFSNPNMAEGIRVAVKREKSGDLQPKADPLATKNRRSQTIAIRSKGKSKSKIRPQGTQIKSNEKPSTGQLLPNETPVDSPEKKGNTEGGFKLLEGTQEILSETAQDLYALVDSPALRHALAAGTYAANAAVTNAMDALFYSLLDRTWPIAKGQFTTLESGIERRLTRLPDKSILVIDRVMIGPRMTRDLIPPSPLGLKTSVASGAYFYEFYLTSDAERINQTNRQVQNNFSAMNWFGLLPFLTRILPPSFDPNELYNPMRVFSVPFKVPLRKSDLQDMEENSIRSYSIKGSITFPLTHSWLISKLPHFALKTGLNAGLPITAYANAEARISVHKHAKNRFKVSLSDIKVEGSNIGIEIGKVFYALGLSAGKFSWKGVPIAIFPFKVSFDTNLFQDQSIIRDVNIDDDLSEEALAATLTGNFTELDRSCIKCSKIATLRNGITSRKSTGFSGFFFDTKKDSTIETTDYSITNDSKNLSYRESRAESTSVAWDIMNGASTSNSSFAWSSPTDKSRVKPLIWTRSSLTIPSIDEENFQEIEQSLALLGFHQNLRENNKMPLEIGTSRSRESLQKMAKMPGILSSQKLFRGPQITGDIDLLFDLYTNEATIQRLAQIPADTIIRHINELHRFRSKFFEKGICENGILESVGASRGLDICEVGEEDRNEITELQNKILKNSTGDETKSSQSKIIKKLGALGFIYLVIQTQSEKDYRLFVNTRCFVHRRSTSSQKANCQNLNHAAHSMGNLPLEDFSWWTPQQAEKEDVLGTKIESLDILNITPSKLKEDQDEDAQDFFDINLRENLKGSIFVYIRIESKGEMDLARSFLFEDVYETNLGMIDSQTISVPINFLDKSSSRIKSYKVNQLRFKISISKDGKTWSKMTTLDGSD